MIGKTFVIQGHNGIVMTEPCLNKYTSPNKIRLIKTQMFLRWIMLHQEHGPWHMPNKYVVSGCNPQYCKNEDLYCKSSLEVEIRPAIMACVDIHPIFTRYTPLTTIAVCLRIVFKCYLGKVQLIIVHFGGFNHFF